MYERYVHVIELVDQYMQIEDIDDRSLAVQQLIGYMNENFQPPTTGKNDPTIENRLGEFREEMDKMFEMDHDTLLSSLNSIPPTILEIYFPVYVLRYILRFGSAQVRLVKTDEFKLFTDRFIAVVFAPTAERNSFRNSH